MKFISLVFFLLISQVVLFSQFDCQFIKLCSQSQVDSFPKEYGHCNKIFSVEIDDDCNWVYNLDSLYQIKELGELIIQRMDSLHSIAGLNNLVKVGRFNMVQRSVLQPLLSLDTIIHLKHTFGRPNLDLSLYNNLNHIDTTLSVINSGLLSGLPQFSSSNKFSLTVCENKLKNDTKNLIPQNVINIDQLYITRNENLSLKGCEKFQRIRRVIIDLNKSCDYSQMNSLSDVDQLQIGSENYDLNNYGIFTEIKSLKRLSLYFMENLKNINILFPNLQEVTMTLSLNNNKHLVDLDILDTFNIPQFPIQTTNPINQRIFINGNPFLADCISPYICKALETYPDSVVIQNNGTNCEKEQLIQDCINHLDEEDQKFAFSLFPNPVHDRLYWSSDEVVDQLDVADISGKLLATFSNVSQGVDVSFLSPGIYYMTLKNKKSLSAHKICVIR